MTCAENVRIGTHRLEREGFFSLLTGKLMCGGERARIHDIVMDRLRFVGLSDQQDRLLSQHQQDYP